MTVAAVLTAIRNTQAGIAGITRAYDGNTPPDSIEDLPAFASFPWFPERGTIDYHPNQTETHTYPITMRLYLTKQDLAQAAAQAVGFFELVRAAFRAHVTLGGLVVWSHIETVQLGAMEYAGEPYIGLDFVLRVQEKGPFVASA